MRPARIVFFLALVLSSFSTVSAQHTYRATVQYGLDSSPLVGVNVLVEGTTIGTSSGPQGLVALSNVPSGSQTIVFSFVGYETTRRTLVFPLDDPESIYVIKMEEDTILWDHPAYGHEESAEPITVMATRSSRTVADAPTRVEVIAGEEIDEKISMEPSNISMLLNESPGITVQPTSAVTGGASIRIQGLDGRYTQILKDGFPLFGGFSGGLSLLQVPPLDLQQVEVIKGPSSTLHGGDAIAGLVNLVSRQPERGPKLSLLANATSALGFDVGGFYSAKRDRSGVTMLASANVQEPYFPDKNLFSNLPKTRRLTLNPKVFLYGSDGTTLSLGLSGTLESRAGGVVGDTRDPFPPPFVEEHTSSRLTSQFRVDRELEGRGLVSVKNSISLFDRDIARFQYRFGGRQLATFTEASLLLPRTSHDLVVGIDVRSDVFKEDAGLSYEKRSYSYSSAGVFLQDTWDVSDRVALETGVRADYHNTFGFFLLPKASVLYRFSESLSARAGGGLGYKAPTVFLEPSEDRAFRHVLPLAGDIAAERSRGGSLDINYRTLLFERLAISVNQAFHFTDLANPLNPFIYGDDRLAYRNADGKIRSRSLESNLRLSLSDFKLFLGYVYLDATAEDDGQKSLLVLTPKHKTYSVLVYEKHGLGRIGLEAYYTGPQLLSDGSETEGYLVTGLMAERRFGNARLFLNFENFLDTKQSNYAPVVRGSLSDPEFAEIWAPMDGFIINGGVKYTIGGD